MTPLKCAVTFFRVVGSQRIDPPTWPLIVIRFLRQNDMEHSLIVVPDTNVFLHCKSLDKLPWGRLAKNDVEVILVDAVLAELDHWKDQGNDRRAKRVRSLLPTLRKLAIAEQDVIDLDLGPPRIRLRLDEKTTQVSNEDNDAAIIDAAAAIQSQSGIQVLVLTRDVLLAARCKRRGTSCLLISPEDKEWNDRPERPDPEVTELKRELEELKQQFPVIELKLETLGGSISGDVLTIFIPKVTRFEHIHFVSQWALRYFEENKPKTLSREWDFNDYAWKRNLRDLDIGLRKLLAKRLAGATNWLTVKNTGSVNAEDVRIELLVEGSWFLARDTPDHLIEVPRPPLRLDYDPNALIIPPPVLSSFHTPMIEPVNSSAPIWETVERDDQPKGVSRLAIRIPVLRHRDAVDVPFRLGGDTYAGTAGKLVIRITADKTVKPVVKTLRLERVSNDVSVGELIELLIERKELEISLEPLD